MSPSANASAVAACTAAGSLPGASSPPVVLLSAAALLAIADEVLVVVARWANLASVVLGWAARSPGFRKEGGGLNARTNAALDASRRGANVNFCRLQAAALLAYRYNRTVQRGPAGT
jgi:hypothetical protein